MISVYLLLDSEGVLANESGYRHVKFFFREADPMMLK